ncbi:MAG: hypothetical protein IJ485_03340 [Lachnospiraceae bacterium]|nr:hypothetical protein [Lachnospiraceae bacterium]
MMDSSMFIGTWWALLPPILAIVLAFITKEVYSSLLSGVVIGVLFYTGFQLFLRTIPYNLYAVFVFATESNSI